MFYRRYFRYSKGILLYVLLTIAVLTACGQEQDSGQKTSNHGIEELVMDEGIQTREDTLGDNNGGNAESVTVEEGTAESVKEVGMAGEVPKTEETDESKELRKRFGNKCIAEQTFEAELSEYDGKVWFVPFAPSTTEGFHMQIMQNEKVLTNIRAYVPEELEKEKFVNLDAVAFFDVNFDNATDIVLIETYGNTSFAVVYYGEVYTYSDGDVSVSFYAEENLSDHVTSTADTLTIPVIRDFLGNGKRNGEYTDYREAYIAVSKLREMESNGEDEYAMIYFDDDDIPELVADHPGYHVSMYTYHDGRIYTLMNQWGYGAGGNHGYEYCPRKGSVRNYDADYAGLILYTTYWELGDRYQLDHVVSIKFLNFIDANGNGLPDGDENETAGYGDKSYVGDVEITWEEESSYSAGEYEWLGSGANGMNFEELTAALSE